MKACFTTLIIASVWVGFACAETTNITPVTESTQLPALSVASRQTGMVKWYSRTKGYGFIAPANSGKDIFVHVSAIERAGLSTLNEGQKIEYRIQVKLGKITAEDLKVF